MAMQEKRHRGYLIVTGYEPDGIRFTVLDRFGIEFHGMYSSMDGAKSRIDMLKQMAKDKNRNKNKNKHKQ